VVFPKLCTSCISPFPHVRLTSTIHSFIESLSRCTDLNPDGQKSTAQFLMTADKRFMLKELVSHILSSFL
jgi:hypothetical protein